METFEITVELATPVMLGKGTHWTLDAVCNGILHEMAAQGLASVDSVASIPIHCDGGLFHSSRARFDGALRSDVVKIGGIRPVKDMQDATSFIAPAKGRRMPKIVTTRGTLKAHLSRHVEIAARSVSWIAKGDPEAVKALIVNAGSIGALRKEGYGRVREVHFEIDPTLDPLFADGKPVRPIPEDHRAAAGLDPALPRVVDAWKPPYFAAENRAVCFIPAA
jgi:hypothetical protein